MEEGGEGNGLERGCVGESPRIHGAQEVPPQMDPYSLDDMGFLVSIESWSADFLDRFAEEEGIHLITEAHRKLVLYAREFYLKKGRSPMPHEYAKEVSCGVKGIYQLFPKGLISIHRLAGLPQPKSC